MPQVLRQHPTRYPAATLPLPQLVLLLVLLLALLPAPAPLPLLRVPLPHARCVVLNAVAGILYSMSLIGLDPNMPDPTLKSCRM